MERLLAADARDETKVPLSEPGMTANSPTVDGSVHSAASVGSGGAGAVRPYSAAHRLGADGGDLLSAADAGEPRDDRGGACASASPSGWAQTPTR